jgi:hypothetical protein
MSCSICTDPFTPHRPSVPCSSCLSEKKTDAACMSCVQRYLTENASSAHCMFCMKNWNTNFMITHFKAAFIHGKLKRRREDVMLDEQKAMLPSTHQALADEKHKRSTKKAIDAQKMKTILLKGQLLRAQNELTTLQNSVSSRIDDEAAPKTSSYHKCPEDECRGFIHNLACNVCQAVVCKMCMQSKSEGHRCDPNLVETVKMLRKDTKPCPGAACKALITKIDGCDQMWCTSCHTTFSWATGAPIVRGNVHNPHYIEFLRNNGTLLRDPTDIPCGGMPSYRSFQPVFRRMFLQVGNDVRSLTDYLTKIVLNFTHNAEVETARYVADDNGDSLTRFRVQYLLKDIDDKRWRSELYRSFKDREKRSEFLQVIVMVNETGATLLRDFLGKIHIMSSAKVSSLGQYVDAFEELTKMLETLRLYSNQELKKIGIAFLNKYPQYENHFMFRRKTDHSGESELVAAIAAVVD